MSKLYTETKAGYKPKKRVLHGGHYWDFFGAVYGQTHLDTVERGLKIEGYYVLIQKYLEKPSGYFIWKRKGKGPLVKREGQHPGKVVKY